VVVLQVAKNLLSRATDEDSESQQGTHMNQLPKRVDPPPPCPPPPPRANAPVGEAGPIVANATVEAILFRSILFVLRRVVSGAKTISSAGLFLLPTCARVNLFIRSDSAWQLQIPTAKSNGTKRRLRCAIAPGASFQMIQKCQSLDFASA
jgi:hypothetical protein